MIRKIISPLQYLLLGVLLTLSACTAAPTPAPTPTLDPLLPQVTSVELDHSSLPRYAALELTVALDADYSNPYDARQVRLDGLFRGPGGLEMSVPGFWDGESSWKLRFTPSAEGKWQYTLTVLDQNGLSLPLIGAFTVAPAEEGHHGWLQPANWVDPSYSSHYLLYHDGTPFYGIGHCDALNILAGGFSLENGVGLFSVMQDAGENFVVWWPLYSNSPIGSSYDDYALQNLQLIDLVVKDAEAKNIFLVFTVWDHPQLRAEGHAWGNGNWSRNGFSQLGTIDEFFTSSEAWAWQENFYRYLIARWGYSPAILMWQTVTEINGTNAYANTDSWHQQVNDYFVANDPYRHPTTASMSGDVDWPSGFEVMDAPQVHIYDLEDATQAAETIASWTERMWQYGKPNWIGEFGVTGNSAYPEMFHHAIWAALASGAAMTPAEWNSSGGWGSMTSDMLADLARLKAFVAEIPLAQLNPAPLLVHSQNEAVRGWGVAGEQGGLFWVQDFSMQGRPLAEVRQSLTPRSGVMVELGGLPAGEYSIRPYDTWQGTYLDAFEIACDQDVLCLIPLPSFLSDMAFQITRK
ncbi:MAG: DUF5060 domain-containing protein [Anaerolineales bacterium]|nr:DUF5060 domain-containing protein [Anaerolineales bacterium]